MRVCRLIHAMSLTVLNICVVRHSVGWNAV